MRHDNSQNAEQTSQVTPESIAYVKKQIKFAGFSNIFDSDIDKQVAEGIAEKKHTTQRDVEKANAHYELDVKIKGDKIYYNGFSLTMTDKATGDQLSQWFQAKDQITSREAVQLLWDTKQPRAVRKEYFTENQGEKEPKWLQIDFNKLTDSGNHLMLHFKGTKLDVAEKLNNYTFQEREQKLEENIKIIEKGGEAVFTPQDTSTYQKVFVSANPEKGTFTIVDEQGKFLPHDMFRSEEARQQVAERRSTYLREHPGGETGDLNYSHNENRRYNPREIVSAARSNSLTP